jgi:hypothetical protein
VYGFPRRPRQNVLVSGVPDRLKRVEEIMELFLQLKRDEISGAKFAEIIGVDAATGRAILKQGRRRLSKIEYIDRIAAYFHHADSLEFLGWARDEVERARREEEARLGRLQDLSDYEAGPSKWPDPEDKK